MRIEWAGLALSAVLTVIVIPGGSAGAGEESSDQGGHKEDAACNGRGTDTPPHEHRHRPPAPEELFNQIDTNKDGAITRAEFLEGFPPPRHMPPPPPRDEGDAPPPPPEGKPEPGAKAKAPPPSPSPDEDAGEQADKPAAADHADDADAPPPPPPHHRPPPLNRRALFEQMDEDGDAKVSKVEFMAGLPPPPPPPRRAPPRQK